MPAFKPRSIDPLYRDGEGRIQRVSETDPKYARLLSQQQAIQRQGYVARIYADPTFVASLKTKINEVNTIWQEKLKAKRATPELLGEKLRHIGGLAVARSGGRIQWWG